MRAEHETISQFATKVLFSTSLADKLVLPGIDILDDGPRSQALLKIPTMPGREASIRLDAQGQGNKNLFPGKSSLSLDRSRGHVLHFFANHELLALELMALALLRWPDAPAGFRRGLVQTMAEEQTHMSLYISRMRELGVTFGELPLNSFFWKCLSHLETPMEFAAAMAMTFEQANIDFALYYEGLFRREGDSVTADIMSRVRLEEIGHVKHGFTWFERWRPRNERLFKEWMDTLCFPMTPARAKGLLFDREGRVAAGLPQDYIDELEVHSQSKGRPPRIFWFNPGCEQEISFGEQKWTPPKPIADLTRDYAILMALFAHSDDVVLVDEAPTTEYLRQYAQWGFTIPEFVALNKTDTLLPRKIDSFHPWGWSPDALRVMAPLKKSLLRPDERLPAVDTNPATSVFSKARVPDIRAKLGIADIETATITSLDQCLLAANQMIQTTASGFVVLKTPFSSSGRGMLRITGGDLAMKDKKWVEDELARHGGLIIEPWLEKQLDFSAHVDIDERGNVEFRGITRFWTDRRGQYRGHLIGRIVDDLDNDLIQLWHKDKTGWADQLKDASLGVGKTAFASGYYGPLGIDAMTYGTKTGTKLRPLLEINPRWSMGRVALAVQRKLAAKHCGILIHISKTDREKFGYDNFVSMTESLQRDHDFDIITNGNAKIIRKGVFPLNDPRLARQSLALLVVGKHHRECYEILRTGGIHDQHLESQIY